MTERIILKKMMIQTYLDTRKKGTLRLESWKFELGSWTLTRHQGSPPQLKELLQPCIGNQFKSISRREILIFLSKSWRFPRKFEILDRDYPRFFENFGVLTAT